MYHDTPYGCNESKMFSCWCAIIEIGDNVVVSLDVIELFSHDCHFIRAQESILSKNDHLVLGKKQQKY